MYCIKANNKYYYAGFYLKGKPVFNLDYGMKGTKSYCEEIITHIKCGLLLSVVPA